jgi:hypothetical protein
MGIPGDVFIKHFWKIVVRNRKAQIAKEFVKFNERCMISQSLMRAYNYVIVPIQ